MKKLLIFATLTMLATSLCAENHIVIDKPTLRLYVITAENDTIENFPVSVGRNYGQKLHRGDNRTPEGKFTISSIEKASGWKQTTSADDGSRVSVYGPWFLRLSCPQSSHIGIHGTYSEKSIGSRESEGCIRMHCADVAKLKENYAFKGMTVIINPDTIKGGSAKYNYTSDTSAGSKSRSAKIRHARGRHSYKKSSAASATAVKKYSKNGVTKKSGKKLRRRRR